MCRSIRPLFNLDPPANDVDVRAASVQFVRKITGFRMPSRVNETAFEAAVDEITNVAGRLFAELETSAPPRNRAAAAERAKTRDAVRFPHRETHRT